MTHNDWMHEALLLADQAALEGEVPVGAVVVYQGNIIGRGYNRPISLCDPSAHAEMLALRDAAKTVGNYRLPGAELFVTLEPCVMCAGLIQHARVQRVVFGAYDLKTGACGSIINVFENTALNHHTHEVVSGVLADESIHKLRTFFRARRESLAKKTVSS
ncbi:MAG: tRNA adenosine(34) deaminase TadA [Pseudomonadota bacterium]